MSFLKKAALIAAVSLLSCGAIAGEPGATVGFKAGKNLIDAEGFDDGSGKAFVLGYDLGNSWSLELDINRGDVGFYDLTLDLDTTAFYGTYRSEGNGYFLAKIGLLKEEVSGYGMTESDTGLSYGIGGGLRFNDKFSLEAEYTIVEADVSFFGLGARVKF